MRLAAVVVAVAALAVGGVAPTSSSAPDTHPQRHGHVGQDRQRQRQRRLVASTEARNLVKYDGEAAAATVVFDSAEASRHGVHSGACAQDGSSTPPGDFGAAAVCCTAEGLEVAIAGAAGVAYQESATYATWVQAGAAAGGDAVFLFSVEGVATPGEATHCETLVLFNGTLRYHYDSEELLGVMPCGSLADGAWHHVAATRAANAVVLYVNGTAIGNTTLSGVHALATAAQSDGVAAYSAAGVGRVTSAACNLTVDGQALTGCLDDARWVQGALSSAQVAELCDGCVFMECNPRAASSSCWAGGWCLILLLVLLMCCLPLLCFLGMWFCFDRQPGSKPMLRRSSAVWPRELAASDTAHPTSFQAVALAGIVANRLNTEPGMHHRRGSLPPIVSMAALVDKPPKEETKPMPLIAEGDAPSPGPVILEEEVARILAELRAGCVCGDPVQLRHVSGERWLMDDVRALHLRVLHTTVVVRVGGGWAELANFIRHHCACSCLHKHQHSRESVRRQALQQLEAFKRKHAVGLAQLKTNRTHHRHGSINNAVTPPQNFGSSAPPSNSTVLGVAGHAVEPPVRESAA